MVDGAHRGAGGVNDLALGLGGLAGLLAGGLVATGSRTQGRSLPSARPTVPQSGRPPAAWRRLRALAPLALAVGVAAVVAPPLAGLVVVAVWVRRRTAARRDRRSRARAVAAGLPEVVDLLLLCSGAGLTLPLAHPLVAERTPGPVGAALGAAEVATTGGRSRADALLAELVPLGDRAAALAHVLVDHLRYGVPLLPGLERLSLELRLDRRRRAEEAARRVPVRMLGPLVTCVLPAFALLTVVPLLAASLRGLPT
jgi:tight adherence protein C